MKLFHNNRYIKQIPAKFGKIENIADYLEDEHSKRLSPPERDSLNKVLLKKQLEDFFAELKAESPALRDMLKDTSPMVVRKIILRNGSYHVVRTNNGVEVKCPAAIYHSSPIKEKIKRLY